jgi:hypothetical protein
MRGNDRARNSLWGNEVRRKITPPLRKLLYRETPIPKAKRSGIGKLNNAAKRRVFEASLDPYPLFQQIGCFGNFHDRIVAFLDDPQDGSYGGKNVMSEKFR